MAIDLCTLWFSLHSHTHTDTVKLHLYIVATNMWQLCTDFTGLLKLKTCHQNETRLSHTVLTRIPNVLSTRAVKLTASTFSHHRTVVSLRRSHRGLFLSLRNKGVQIYKRHSAKHLFKQRGEKIGKNHFNRSKEKKASILTDRSMKFESSCDLHTVLVCSQMNKTGALTSEPFMKGMFLVENFSRDLHKRFRQVITGKSWMTNDNWWKETPLYYCVIQHFCLKQKWRLFCSNDSLLFALLECEHVNLTRATQTKPLKREECQQN